MEVFRLDFVSVPQHPGVSMSEVFKSLITNALIDRESLTAIEALASKKPRPRKSTPRSVKRKTTAELRRGKVLVVDDVPDVTEMIGLLLKHAGYDVSTADSAKGALRLARKRNYDIIISDIGMPEMNGYEFATELRKLVSYDRTPMIAVTGYSEYDDRGRAVNAGFDIHLTKPIEPAQLLELMARLLTPSETNH
jgi:two-component system CheB/CheR fusion protein